MALSQDFPGVAAVEERAALAFRLPVGAFSPLWGLFGAAASAGVAYWWMTRWTQAVNIEALAGLTLAPAPTPAPTPAPAPIPAPQPVEIVAEPAPVAEVAAEAAPAVVAEPAPEIVAAPAPKPVAKVVAKAPKAPPVVAEPPAPDDLTRMVGIGPKLSLALAERGVTRFADIAAWTAKDLAAVDVALSLKGRAVREAWVAQAKRLAE